MPMVFPTRSDCHGSPSSWLAQFDVSRTDASVSVQKLQDSINMGTVDNKAVDIQKFDTITSTYRCIPDTKQSTLKRLNA